MQFRLTKIDNLGFIAPLICFGFAWLVSHFDWFQRFEWKTLDWRTQVRAEWGQASPDERIQIIGIGDKSTLNIEPWPFRRSYHGQMQYLMGNENPAVIVWDIIFANRVDMNGQPLDEDSDLVFAVATEELANQGTPVVFAAVSSPDPTGDSLAELGKTQPITNVIGSRDALSGDAELTMPFPRIREWGYFGTADAPRGAGGIIRKMPMIVRVKDQVFPSLSLQAVMRFWGLNGGDLEVVIGDRISLGPKAEGRIIPIDEAGMMLINFRYETMNAGDQLGIEFPTMEYYDQLVALTEKYVRKNSEARPPVSLDGNIVLVGEFSTDTATTPRNDQSPLVLMHANVLNNILQSDYVRLADRRIVWAGVLILSYLGVIFLRKKSVFLLALFALVAVIGYVSWGFFAWMEWSLWLPLSAPVLGFAMLQFAVITQRVVAEQTAKIQVRAMFGSYVSPVVVKQMIAAETQPELGGVDEEITGYFSDIQSFSSFSEVLSTSQLVELLNEYLTVCTDIIQAQGGTLDKYIGDAVVAMFGAPVYQAEHAYKACLTSQLVQQQLGDLRLKWKGEGDKWPSMVHNMRTRIGLNTGVCMIGNMGSRSRFNYTMMGDNVNLAARMESGAKSWGVFDMVSESTRSACEAFGGDQIIFRSLGRITVQGRSTPVPIHEVVGLKSAVSAQTHECLALFAEGMDRHYAQDWKGAAEKFARSAQLEFYQRNLETGIKSNPSLIYGNIVKGMAEHPPMANWDGVFRMTQK